MTTLHTKFGNARIQKSGYYQITSRKEGNNKKYLHKLIYEDYYKVCLLEWAVIHHIDGNPTNNDISNLKAMDFREHHKLHSRGENNVMYGKTKEKHHLWGVPRSEKFKEWCSKFNSCMTTESGYYRVYKSKCPRCHQGFVWKYQYYVNKKRKSISSIDLKKLEKKVKKKGLPFFKINKDKLTIIPELYYEKEVNE